MMRDSGDECACIRCDDRPWVQTRHGRVFPLVDPASSDVHADDMAWHLAHLNRFGGAAGVISVAQHSVFVACLLPNTPQLRAYGLLHDAHEYPMGDITTPAQRALAHYGMDPNAIRQMKDALDRAIFDAAGLDWPMPPQIAAAVHAADQQALVTEKRDLLVPAPKPWGFEHVTPAPVRIVRWPAQIAEAMFLRALRYYLPLTLGKV